MSPPIPNHIDVNQGGNVSGLLFRKYLADLDEYLCKGVCIGDTIIAHLLWADDLILFTDSIKRLQKQSDGLFNFCSDNMMIVNETKPKVMVCGSASRDIVVKFNDKVLDVVDQYKYLGNLMNSVKRGNQDVFGANYQYLCNKARQAVFAMFKRLKNIGALPIKIMIFLFQSLIKPVLVYGSDVWGVNISATKSVDKVFLWYARTILRVKSNACNLITLGECGVLPPSIICHKQALCYYKRLHAMNDNSLVKKVFINLRNLADMGFRTWITSVRELASKYDVPLDNELTEHEFKLECVNSLERTFISEWEN